MKQAPFLGERCFPRESTGIMSGAWTTGFG